MREYTIADDQRIWSEVEAFALAEMLPESFTKSFMQWQVFVVERLAALANRASLPPLVGLSGCQGCGKSTVARIFGRLLERVHGLNTAVLSLDDFYLTQSERASLANSLHPLFETRGVPGTHDIDLLQQTLQELRIGSGKVRLPRFDKASDDRTKLELCPLFSAPAQIILLEGWCVGVPPQAKSQIEEPINDLEAKCDPEGVWRNEVNRQLANAYGEVFTSLDMLMLFQAPSFDVVFDWRWEQEHRLATSFLRDHPDESDPTMTQTQVGEFVLYYQRLTEHALSTLPQISDYTWELARDRSVCSFRERGLAT